MTTSPDVHHIRSGRVRCITDHGSIVMVSIEDGVRLHHLAADGNTWRRSGAASAVAEDDLVEFGLTDWGGLAFIAPFAEVDA